MIANSQMQTFTQGSRTAFFDPKTGQFTEQMDNSTAASRMALMQENTYRNAMIKAGDSTLKSAGINIEEDAMGIRSYGFKDNSNALTEAKTFGQLIAKWETEKPIPEPDEDFKDVDGISDFVDIFMRGHLAKMMGLKNGYSEKYDSYIEQYSAKKHEYTEDETSQSMYDQIFGGDMDE